MPGNFPGIGFSMRKSHDDLRGLRHEVDEENSRRGVRLMLSVDVFCPTHRKLTAAARQVGVLFAAAPKRPKGQSGQKLRALAVRAYAFSSPLL